MNNKKTWGGRRCGAGRPVIHTDPAIKERSKKFRATDREWEHFMDQFPDDTREAFLYLKELFDELNDYG